MPPVAHSGAQAAAGGGAGARQSILPLFPLLASHHPHTRIDAALDLLDALPLAEPKSADLPYALKRLVAGLASSNDAARQGFAVALAQLTALLPDHADAARVLPQLLEATASRPGIDAREERDLLFARLVGLHALVRSGVLVRDQGPTVAERGQPWKDVILALVALANRKSWIREPSYWVVCEALRSLLEHADDDAHPWRQEAAQWAVQRLVGDARERARGWSPEKVAIVLVFQRYNVVRFLTPTVPHRVVWIPLLPHPRRFPSSDVLASAPRACAGADLICPPGRRLVDSARPDLPCRFAPRTLVALEPRRRAEGRPHDLARCRRCLE